MALLSIVLPAYNEEQNIANTSKVLSQLLMENEIDYELVFISDGSKDETFHEIQKAASDNPLLHFQLSPNVDGVLIRASSPKSR